MIGRRTKALILSVAFLLILGIFAGCDSADKAQTEPEQTTAAQQETDETATPENETTEDVEEMSAMPLADGDVTFTAWWPINADVQKVATTLNDTEFFKKMEEITGIHIDFVHPTVGQEQQAYNLMVVSGDMTDIIYNYMVQYPGGYDKAIEDGVYIKVNELAEQYAPNYEALRNLSEDIRKQTITDSGNLCGFFSVTRDIQDPFVGLVARKDWMDKLGIETPTTYDEMHDMLVQFKENGMTEAPLGLSMTGFSYFDELNAGYGAAQGFYQVDGTVKYGPLEEGYKQYLQMLNQWYLEGLIDQDFYANLSDTNTSGVWTDAYYMFKIRKLQAQDPDYELVALPTPRINEEDQLHLRHRNFNIGNNVISITGACKDPVLVTKWLDYIYSPEGTVLANYGIEGETFEYVDGAPQLKELIYMNPDGLSMLQATYKYLLHDGPMEYHWERELIGYTPEELAASEVWKNSAEADYMLPIAMTMNADEGAGYAEVMADINTYVLETAVKFIIGIEPFDNYDAFVNQIETMDINTAIIAQQAALDRYNDR